MKVNEGLLAFFAEEDVVFAQLAAPLVHAAAALGQGDVGFLGYQEGGVEPPGLEGGDDAAGKEPVLDVFQETAPGLRLPLVSMPLRLVQSTSSPKKETDNSNNQGKTRGKTRVKTRVKLG